MSGEPFRRVSKASLDDLQKLLNKLIENTGKKTIIIFGDQEMNAKWAAVTLKNKSCRKKPKFRELIGDWCLGEHWLRNCRMKISPVCLFRGHSDSCVTEKSQKKWLNKNNFTRYSKSSWCGQKCQW